MVADISSQLTPGLGSILVSGRNLGWNGEPPGNLEVEGIRVASRHSENPKSLPDHAEDNVVIGRVNIDSNIKERTSGELENVWKLKIS